ncbi:MAG: DUF3137 domain-containing protein [bacterium]
MSNKLESFYNTELLSEIKGLEHRRQEVKKKIAYCFFIPLAVFFLLSLYSQVWDFFLGGIFFSAFCAAFLSTHVKRSYVNLFKERVITKLIAFVSDDLKYDYMNFISQKAFEDSCLFVYPRIDKYIGEDYVAGKIGKTEIAFSEIHARYKKVSYDTEGRRKTSWYDIFKGLFFVIDFNKKFHSRVIIKPSALGMIGKKIQLLIKNAHIIKLENAEFDKQFTVYGTDQQDARYILTPKLIERLLELNKEIAEKKVKNNKFMQFLNKKGISFDGNSSQFSLSFINSQLNIAVPHSKNLFQPRIWGDEVVKKEDIEEYYDYLILIKEIVEILDLNTRIWTKE